MSVTDDVATTVCVGDIPKYTSKCDFSHESHPSGVIKEYLIVSSSCIFCPGLASDPEGERGNS